MFFDYNVTVASLLLRILLPYFHNSMGHSYFLVKTPVLFARFLIPMHRTALDVTTPTSLFSARSFEADNIQFQAPLQAALQFTRTS